MTEQEKKNDVLKNKSTFGGWHRQLLSHLRMKKLITMKVIGTGENATKSKYQFITVDGKEDIVADTILSRVSQEIAGKIPDHAESPADIMKYLIQNYGPGDPFQAKNKFRNFTMIGIDATFYVTGLDQVINNALLAGATVSEEEIFDKLSNEQSIHANFYQSFIVNARLKYGKEFKTREINAQLREDLKATFDATPESIRRKAVAERTFKGNRANWEDRHCDHCSSADEKRKSKAKTHNTDNCSFNKTDKRYVIFDSGAEEHFTPSIGDTLDRSTKGKLESATGATAEIIGKTKIKFGSIVVDALVCPSISDTLLSGGKLTKAGFTTILKTNVDGKNSDLIIMDEKNHIAATGKLNEKNMFIVEEDWITPKKTFKSKEKMKDLPIKSRNCFLSLKEHEENGHIGSPDETCEPCIQSSRKRNVQRSSEKIGNKTKYEPLSVIDVDVQGPFPLDDLTGNKLNLKLVDVSSGYIKTEILDNRTAKLAKECLERFVKRMECQTGFKVKIVRTDGDTCFNGPFLKFCEENGIVKRKGQPYDHHYPPMAEKANGIINKLAKSNLLASNLPGNFYHEAILYSTYVYNNSTVHGPSKFSKLFGYEKDLKKFPKFGQVCFVFVPKEKREWKLAKTRERGRIIGFADDDDSEEMAGYKIYMERDGAIIYSNDVKFTDLELKPLPEKEEDYFHTLADSDFDPFETLDDPNEISGTTLEEEEPGLGDPEENNVQRDEEEYQPSETSEDIRQAEIFNELQTRDWYANDDGNIEDEEDNVARALFAKYKCFRVHKQDPTIPKNLFQAQKSPEWQNWKAAMDDEMENMSKMQVWKEVVKSLPPGERAIDTIWVFAKKYDEQGVFLKYKARLVARGFLERFGIDYEETFAPVCRYAVVRLFCAIAASRGWKIFQDDCTAAYLNAWLEKGKWIKLPDGSFAFIQKALYGLKESPREWFQTVKAYMISDNFKQSEYDPCVFYKSDVMVSIFVDDTISMGIGAEKFRRKFKEKFPSKSGGEAHHFIGLRISNQNDSICIDQEAYINQKLTEYEEFLDPNTCYSSPLLPDFAHTLTSAEKSDECEPSFPYRSMVGSLVHVMNGTRFDIAAAVSIVSRYLNSPKKIHCDMVRRIYYYLRGNPLKHLEYKKGDMALIGFCDSSYANLENYASLSGYAFKLGGSLIEWKSMRQPVVALSTAESEYIALTPCFQAGLWLRGILSELGVPQKATTVYEDNAACIFMAKNPQNSKRTRHIQVRYHWIRQYLENNSFKLQPCKTENQLADIFTKGAHGPQIRSTSSRLGMMTSKSPKLGES